MENPLFIHNPKNLLIGCKQRCGHTAMFTRYKIPVNNYQGGITTWINRDPGVQKTMVLRHPIERMHSAIGWYNKMFSEAIEAYDYAFSRFGKEEAITEACNILDQIYSKIPENQKVFYNADGFVSRKLTLDYIAHGVVHRENIRKSLIYQFHCDPYMHHILDVDFKYIPFENLEDYLGTNRIGLLLYENNRSLDSFENNSFFTRDDLLKEVEHYEYLIQNKEKLSLEEWFGLT